MVSMTKTCVHDENMRSRGAEHAGFGVDGVGAWGMPGPGGRLRLLGGALTCAATCPRGGRGVRAGVLGSLSGLFLSHLSSRRLFEDPFRRLRLRWC